MTTLDTLVSFAERVETANVERKPIDWRRLFIGLIAAIPYVMGKWVGRMVYGARIMASAAREGYHEGNAPTTAPRRPLVATAGAPSTVDG